MTSANRSLGLAAISVLVLVQLAAGGPAEASTRAGLPTIQVPTMGYGQQAPESMDDPMAAASPALGGPDASATPAAVRTAKSPLLTLTIDFDDGTADQYQAGAMLKAHEMAGVFFVNSGRIGLTKTYLTIAQIRQLQADGDEIAGHTVFHLHLPQQSFAEQERQICTDRDQLLALGFRVTDLAFPFGDFTAASQQAARDCGYDSVRTTESGRGGQDSLPPVNRYDLEALSSLGSTTTAAYITSAVIAAERRGGLLQLVFHKVCARSPCRDNAIRLSVLRQVLDWLSTQRAAGRLRVTTVANAIGGPLLPRVAAPAPTATFGVVNPSFEQGSLAATVPMCWEHAASGDGDIATWSLVRSARTGRWAEHVSASRVTDGIALVVTQDEGSCAAPVVAGHRYTYGVWYESSASVRLVSYRRLTTGGYLTFGLSNPFPASPGHWSYATVSTRPMPTGSTGLSIGVAIRSDGQFSFDDFALHDSGAVAASSADAPAGPRPTVAALTIPVVAPGATAVAVGHRSGWPRKATLGAVLILLVLSLALIDWRLGRLRRRSLSAP